MTKKRYFLSMMLSVVLIAFTATAGLTAPTHFTGVNTTPNVCDYAGKVTVDGVNAADNADEVGVFVGDGSGGELLVGAAVIGETTPGYYFVHIYGDDTTTGEKDGALSNEQLIFKVWDSSTNTEFPISSSNMATESSPPATLPSIPPVYVDATQLGLLNLAAVSEPGTISGQVSYSGTAPGTYIIAAFDSSLGGDWNNPIHDPEYYTTSTNGSYTLTNVSPGSYFIAAFRDSNGNYEGEDYEPAGFYTGTTDPVDQNGLPAAVVLASGASETVNFTIYDRPYFADGVDVDRDIFPDSGQPSNLPTGEVLWAEAEVGYRPGTNLVTVTVTGPGISTPVQLYDDGQLPDEAANDGVFTGWIDTGGPVQNGTYEFLITSDIGIQEDDEDDLQGSALALPTLDSPGDYVVSFTPTFDWGPVIGATYYSLYITDNSNPTSFADFVFIKEDMPAAQGTQYALTTQDLPLLEGSTYYWFVGVEDTTGDNYSYSEYRSFTVVTIPPNSTATPDPGFYKADFDVTLTADKPGTITYTTDGSDPKTSGTAVTEISPVTISITTEGTYTIQFFATDLAGNVEGDTNSLQVTLDKTAPVTTPSLAEGTYGTAKSVTLSATDTNLDAIYYDLLTSDPGATPSPPTTPYTDAINLAESGEKIDYWLVYYSVDQAENAESVKVVKYTIDTRVPETTASFDPQPNQYDTSYYSNNQAGVTITLTSQGNTIYYTTDGSEPTESSDSFQDSGQLNFDTEGTHTVRYFAKNPQDLTEEKRTLVLVLDFTPPATPVLDPAPTSPTNATPQTIGGTKDADTAIYLQGVDDPIVVLNDAAIWSYNYPLQEGSNQFALVAKDPAGNASAPTAQTTIVLDTVRPYTDGHDPVRNTTVPQPLNKKIIVHVKDDGVGVEQSSIILTVAGVQYLYDNAAISINAANVNDMVLTFTPPENYSADTNVSVKVEVQDLAGNAMTPDVYTFLTGSNVGITPTAIGLAVDDTFTFTATGGSTPYTWSRSPEANSSITPINETTADFSASAVGQYTVTVTDDANDEASATVDVVTPITISTTPANDSLESGSEFTFAASGGKVEGEVVWDVDQGSQGSIDPASGLYTVTTADTIQVTVTAYDATYNKSHVSPVKGSYTFTVYPEVALTNIPDTAPTVQPGETYDVTLTPSGGSGEFEWMVTTDPSGTFGDWVEQPTFDFVAPDTGPFAGLYEITLRDKNNPDFTATFQIKVPLVFEPKTKNIKGGDSFDLVLKGADANATADYEFTGDVSADTYTTLDPNPAFFEAQINQPTTATTQVTVSTVTELKKFKIKATVTGDDDLEAAGLNIASTGWIRVLPTVEFSGVIEEAQGGLPIPGATIMFKLSGKTRASTTSAADGSFTVSLLKPSIMGAQYTVIALAANYLTSVTTTADWENPQTIELTPAEDSVSGTVSDGANPIEGALIECLVNDEPIVAYSNAGGNYTLYLPVLQDALAGELMARAVKEGYVAASQNVLVDPDFTLTAQVAPGNPQNVCEDGGSFSDGECSVGIPAETLDQCYDLNIDPQVDVGPESVYSEHSVVLVAIDLGGAALAKPIEICIPFDTTDVNPGDFKAGIAFLYHAPTTADFRNGTNIESVPTSDITYEDHLKPEVCFHVSTLSTFGAGSATGGAAAADGGGGGGGGCFIATAASGPGAVMALLLMLLALLSIAGVLILTRLPGRQA